MSAFLLVAVAAPRNEMHRLHALHLYCRCSETSYRRATRYRESFSEVLVAERRLTFEPGNWKLKI